LIGFPDATLYRKSATIPPRAATDGLPVIEWSPSLEKMPLGEESVCAPTVGSAPAGLTAQTLANQGDLSKALSWCDRAIEADALNPAHRFLRAMIAQEQGSLDDAVKFLGQALYLDANFVMAHFALGNLSKRLGRREQSIRHFRNVATLLDGMEPDAPLPEAGGLTAGRLTEMLRSTRNGGGGDV
jgi:hypothetical protein